MMRLLCFFLLLLYVLPASGQSKDSIFLYNGQVLIGDIKGLQMAEILIDDVDLRRIEIKLYKIKRLVTLRRYKIETTDKKLYFGTLRESSKKDWIDIVTEDGKTFPTAIIDLYLMSPLERSFFSSLTGSFSAGLSYTKTTKIAQLNLSSTVQYAAKKFEYQLSASANSSIDSTGFSMDRTEVGLLAGYYLTPSWFVATSGNYQRNLELSIARRYQELVGAGNKLFVRKNWQLMGISGVAFNQERSTDNVSSGLLIEIPLLMRFTFFQYHNPNIQITSSQSLYYGITQTNRIRYDGNTSFSWELIRYFYITLNPYTNYDSRPPAGNINFDYGITFSLSYKF